MGWTDIGGNYHWGGTPGWTAAPEPVPEPAPPPPPAPAPAPVAPPVAASAAPVAPVVPEPIGPIGPAISPGAPVVSKLQTTPTSTGGKLAQAVMDPDYGTPASQKPIGAGGAISINR